MVERALLHKSMPLDLGIHGTTGLKQYGGWVVEEFLPRLQGRQGVLVYREIVDNSSVHGAIKFAIESLLRQVEWRVEPSGDSPEAREQAEFVEGALDDMSHTFEDLLVEILSHLWYGWSYHEIVYKLRRGPDASSSAARSKFDDGKVGWRKLPIRSQDTLDRWEFDPADNGVRGMWQMDPYTGGRAFIPIEKALLFRAGVHKSNPEGRSIFRNSILDHFKLKRISDIEAVGIERDMTGLLDMQVPMEILTASAGSVEAQIRSELERMLATVKRDEREFVMRPTEVDQDGKPTGYKLQLLATGGRRQIDTTEVKNYYVRRILQTVLFQFLELGQETGSWSLASSMTKLSSVALGAVMDSITAVLNRFAIPRLMDLNGVPSDLHPHIVHGDIESPPLDEVAQYITALATAGMLSPTKQLERKLLEIGRLPAPPIAQEDRPLPGEEPEGQLELPLPGAGSA
jgi:hypothetical protein